MDKENIADIVKNYAKRLYIPVTGDETTMFWTGSTTLVAKGYSRVVIGRRGPYIEFERNNLEMDNFIIPEDQKYRVNYGYAFYIEHRSKDQSNVKVYQQKRIVDYADYVVGRFYISPFDLFINFNHPVIQLRKSVHTTTNS